MARPSPSALHAPGHRRGASGCKVTTRMDSELGVVQTVADIASVGASYAPTPRLTSGWS